MLQLSKSRQHLASSILGEIQAGILSRAITVTFDHRMTGEWLTLRHQSMNFSLSARYNLQSVPAVLSLRTLKRASFYLDSDEIIRVIGIARFSPSQTLDISSFPSF